MKEREFRDLMTTAGVEVTHHKGVVYGWCASFRGETIVCSKDFNSLVSYMTQPFYKQYEEAAAFRRSLAMTA